MFGRKPNLPIDAVFEQAKERDRNSTTRDYIEELKDRLRRTKEIVDTHTSLAKQKQKKNYDKKIKGDKVLVKILSRGEDKHKIADRYEEQLYTVIEQPRAEIPVFIVKSDDGQKVKTLHRNHLYPVNHLCDIADETGERLKDDVDEIVENDQKLDEASEDKRDAAKEVHVDKSDVTSDDDSDDCVDQVVVSVPMTDGDAHGINTDHSEKEGKVSKESRNVARQSTRKLEDSLRGHKPKDKIVSKDKQSHNLDTTVNTDVTDRDIDNADRKSEIRVLENHDNVDHDGELGGAEIQLEQVHEEIESDINSIADDTLDTTVSDSKTGRKKKRVLPDLPRRSTRQRKKPERLGDYHLFSAVNNSPYDNKFHALEVIVASGVLGSMDRDTAKRVVNAIMM